MTALKAELVALESIYDGFLQVSHQPDCKLVVYEAPPLRLQFYIAESYPDAKPAHVLKQQGVPSTLLKSVSEDLDQLLEELLGSECLFQAIEFVRERLDNYTARQVADAAAAATKTATAHSATQHKEHPEPHSHCEEKQQHQSRPTPLSIHHGSKLVDRKSTFQAHMAIVKSREEVEGFKSELLEDRKIAKATHNMLAYRFTTPEGSTIYDNDEDGEAGAGRRLSELLQLMNATNVAVLVTRWYGGIQLGPDRFRHISNVARELLEQNGFGRGAK